MTKEKALQKIAQEIENCTLCKKDTTGKAVPGEGNQDAKIVFVGEAPGKKEAATGRPFIGRSGQLLRNLIQEIGLQEKDVFITSVGKYLPLAGTPSASQIAHGRTHLLEQLAVIKPEIVVLLGSVAVQGVLQEKVPVKSMHGTTKEKDGQIYFITLHPAAGLRFPPLKMLLREDFQTLRKVLIKTGIL